MKKSDNIILSLILFIILIFVIDNVFKFTNITNREEFYIK